MSVGTFLEEISKRAGEFIEKIFSNMGINFLFLLELRCSSPIPGYPGAPGSLASGFGPNNTTSFPRLTGCGDSQPTQSHEPILRNKPLFSFLLLLSLFSILLVLFLYRAPATLTLFFQLLSLLAEGDTATWMFPVCPGSLTCLFCTWGGQPHLASAGLHMDEGQTLRHP